MQVLPELVVEGAGVGLQCLSEAGGHCSEDVVAYSEEEGDVQGVEK